MLITKGRSGPFSLNTGFRGQSDHIELNKVIRIAYKLGSGWSLYDQFIHTIRLAEPVPVWIERIRQVIIAHWGAQSVGRCWSFLFLGPSGILSSWLLHHVAALLSDTSTNPLFSAVLPREYETSTVNFPRQSSSGGGFISNTYFEFELLTIRIKPSDSIFIIWEYTITGLCIFLKYKRAVWKFPFHWL